MKKNCGKRLKKFFINGKVKKFVLITDVVLVLLYVALLFIINNAEQILCLKNEGILYQCIELLSQIILISFSIITTTLFSSWLIETNNKNEIYSDIVCNDFLASPEFYNALKDEHKRAILNSFEKEYYFEGSDEKEEMYNSITNKLKTSGDIYYDSCKYDVDCKIDGNLIRKDITRTTTLFTYGDNCNQKNFPIIGASYGKIDGVESFSLKSLEINGTEIDLNDLDKKVKKITDISLQKCGYTESIQYFYKKNLTLQKKLSMTDRARQGITIRLKYSTIVSKDDISYVCRVKYPCKNFSLRFRLTGKEASKFEVAAHSFGFIEGGKDSGNDDNRSVVNVDFNDWIFQSDGVAVVISEKIS